MFIVFCRECGHKVETDNYIDYIGKECEMCGSIELDIEQVLGDNFPVIDKDPKKQFYQHNELLEIQKIIKENRPKITKQEIEDFVLDLELKTVDDFLKLKGEVK